MPDCISKKITSSFRKLALSHSGTTLLNAQIIDNSEALSEIYNEINHFKNSWKPTRYRFVDFTPVSNGTAVVLKESIRVSEHIKGSTLIVEFPKDLITIDDESSDYCFLNSC